jgi:hypothetical protein
MVKYKPKDYMCGYCLEEFYGYYEKCIRCNEVGTVVPLTKPILAPVGIAPKSIWIAHRIEELKTAIKRYLDANYPVPHEWYEEIEEHIRGLQQPKKEP